MEKLVTIRFSFPPPSELRRGGKYILIRAEVIEQFVKLDRKKVLTNSTFVRHKYREMLCKLTKAFRSPTSFFCKRVTKWSKDKKVLIGDFLRCIE